MKNLIADVHCHPLLPGFLRVLERESGKSGTPGTAMGLPLPPWSFDAHIEVMDRHDIDISVASMPGAATVISGPGGASQARALNEELASFVSLNPHRLGAFAVVPMDDPDAAMTEMAYALDVLRLDGVYADTHLHGKYLGDASFDPWFAEMNRRGVTLFVHPTAPPDFDAKNSPMHVSVLEFMFDTTRMVTNMVLSGAKERFPNINIIATHGGGTIPYLAQRIGLAGSFPWAYRNGPKLQTADILITLGSFYYDLTASTSPASLDAILRLVPVERLLMGFDFPMMPSASIAPTIRHFLESPKLDVIARRQIIRQNFLRLFPRRA